MGQTVDLSKLIGATIVGDNYGSSITVEKDGEQFTIYIHDCDMCGTILEAERNRAS